MSYKYFLVISVFTMNLLKHSDSVILDEYNTFRDKDLASINNTILDSYLEPFINEIPVFNASTVPNLDSIMELFNAGSENEDIHLNITQMIQKYGYEVEEHQVETIDGYLLEIYRLPGKGPAALLVHGMLCSSDPFVCSGPTVGLPFLLADAGYDVWLGNCRGNVHGRRHVTLSPDSAEFWQFSFHEIGRYDLPATIDYILKEANQEKLAYIGHSQGTTVYYVMASEIPEYNDKISVMISLSPVAFVSHTENVVMRILARLTDVGDFLSKAIGLYEFSPRNQIMDIITSKACGTKFTASIFCDRLMFLLTSPDFTSTNITILPAFYGHFPAGCSTKQILHFGQLVTSGKFRRYDYGVSKNILKYGKSTPLDYPLEKIRSKVAIFHSDNDNFCAPADLSKLVNKLPNVIENYRVEDAKYNHLDVIIGKRVRQLVYEKVASILSDHV